MSPIRFHRHPLVAALMGLIAVGAIGLASPVRANDNPVYWSIGVAPAPGVAVGVSNVPPVTYAPPRVMYAPPRVIYTPPPVWVQTMPVYVQPLHPGHGHGHGKGHGKGHGHHKGHDKEAWSSGHVHGWGG